MEKLTASWLFHELIRLNAATGSKFVLVGNDNFLCLQRERVNSFCATIAINGESKYGLFLITKFFVR